MGAQASRSRWRHAPAAQNTGSDPSSAADKIKVVLLGDAAVGKTTLFRRWIGTVLDAEYAPSTTAGVGAKLLRLEGHEPVVVELWDVPPQSFAGSSIFARYLRSTQAIVLVFSLQEPVSWRTLPKYLDVARHEIAASESIDTGSSKAPTVVMVGNKSDCIDVAGFEEQQAARAWCNEYGVTYVEVSALAGDTAALLGALNAVSVLR